MATGAEAKLHPKARFIRTLRGVGGLNAHTKDLIRPISGIIVPYPPPATALRVLMRVVEQNQSCPKALRTHILRFLGLKTILYMAVGPFGAVGLLVGFTGWSRV